VEILSRLGVGTLADSRNDLSCNASDHNDRKLKMAEAWLHRELTQDSEPD